jgi:hypothetical protein
VENRPNLNYSANRKEKKMARKVLESNVISGWGVLAEGQAGQESRFFELVEQRLDEHGWPYQVRSVDVGGGFFSSGQPYLQTEAGKLVAFIGAESIGKDAYFAAMKNSASMNIA